MKVNLKLKEIIDERGIKQSHICQKANMSADCVSRILNCTRKLTAEEFLRICDVLGIDTEQFKDCA